MIKKILEILNKIKCKLSCCYESQCSLNENKINDNNINGKTSEDSKEFKPK